MTPINGVPVHFLNVEYFFRILYETIFGVRSPILQIDFMVILAQFWLWVTTFSFLISIGILAVFVYSTLRYRQINALDEAKYATVHDAHQAVEEVENKRWKRVLELIESTNENDWRQAIIEADIFLYDALEHAGYEGTTVGEKLKQVTAHRFASVQDAWEAHKVRNDIAHQGQAYQLTYHNAYRAIQRYETVLREFGEIV